MNFSIYLKLRKAFRKGQVKIPFSYKFSDVIFSNGWLERKIIGLKKTSYPSLLFDKSEYCLITTKGKEKFIKYRRNIFAFTLTTIFSIITITISLFALLK